MAIKMTREEYERIYGGGATPTSPQTQAPATGGGLGVNLGITDAFKGGVSQAKQGYSDVQNASNPIQALEGGTKLAAGGFNAAFSPLSPLMKPFEMATNYASDKISNIPAVQKFAMSGAGKTTSRVAEDVNNLNTVVGGVAGVKGAEPIARATGEAVGGAVKPVVAGTGRALKSAGETAYSTTVTSSEGTNRLMSSYKEQSPNVMSRVKDTLTGNTEGKPITEPNTAARYGLMGTEKEIGVQSGRHMKKIWNEKVLPALRKSKGTLDMGKFFDVIQQKITEQNPELSRQKTLIEALDSLKEDYSGVKKANLEDVQKFKEGWVKFLPDAVWKGKPIANALKEVKDIAGDTAREFIYKNTDPSVRQDYIDYGNLKSIHEAGIKSGVGDLAKKSPARGAWQFLMDTAITPVATTMGKILYRTGEGLEFVGESGAKTVGDIMGDVKPRPNPQSGMVKNPFVDDKVNVADALENYDTTPMKVNGKLDMSSSDVDFRLEQLKAKDKAGKLTEADLKEAETLLKKIGALK